MVALCLQALTSESLQVQEKVLIHFKPRSNGRGFKFLRIMPKQPLSKAQNTACSNSNLHPPKPFDPPEYNHAPDPDARHKFKSIQCSIRDVDVDLKGVSMTSRCTVIGSLRLPTMSGHAP
jgi:hypothetical protein